jgi:FkbM family methyltransferase
MNIVDLPVIGWRFLTWPRFSITSHAMVSGLWRQGLRPGTVLDVGANTGQFSVATWKLLNPERIYAFEPTPACAKRLRRILKRCPAAEVLQTAVGERCGVAEFNLNSHSHSNSIRSLEESHKAAFPHAVEAGRIEVPITTLDAGLEGRLMPGPVLLKIDVQGYESSVIAGVGKLWEVIDWVLLEASLRPLYKGEALFHDLQGQLSALGYRFLRPVGQLADPRTGEIIQMDCLFGRS